METLTFHLEDFEGPLDLLLHLISKNKMDLHDIPILELIDQYTAVIGRVQADKLDVASEFIEMAAQLVQMKSYLLLPRSEEAERMKAELQGQLIEYDLCKRIAAQMREMQEAVCMASRAPMDIELDMTYKLRHDPLELEQAWHSLMGRAKRKKAPPQERFEPLVAAPFVSVESRVLYVLRGMISGKLKKLTQLFLPGRSRSETVATFLAVLALMRSGRVIVEGDESLSLRRGKTRKLKQEDYNS